MTYGATDEVVGFGDRLAVGIKLLVVTLLISPFRPNSIKRP